MRTDRELLELAAKAAGVVGEWCEIYHGILLTETQSNEGCDIWTPLVDDGDALRLAVELSLHVKICRRMVLVEGRELGDDQFERLTPDPYAATRRAIVRAAAEIGATM